MWGDSGGHPELSQVVADPLNSGNLCGKILPHTATPTHYYGVFLNQSVLPAANMKDYDYNVLSFKVQLPSGNNWDNWDKAALVKWARGDTNDWAYGTDVGTGFSIASESGVGKAQGSFGYGTSKAGGNYVAPGHAYHTSMDGAVASYGSAAWVKLTMVMDRTTGTTEWYRNDVLFASKTLLPTAPDYAEWFYGNDLDPLNPRWFQWLDVGA